MGKFNDIVRSNTPTLVDFYATWCGPCQTMHPVLDRLKSEMGEQVRILKIDVDKNPDIADKFPQFRAGQILVSLRSIGTLAVLDPATRKIIWVYRGYWSYEHAASFTPSGHIVVLDNVGYMSHDKTYSRVIEFDPATLHTTWEFAGSQQFPFYTSRMGRVQRLPDGNTLIDEAENARILEVTPDGRIAWSYRLQKIDRGPHPSANAITGADRYPTDAFPFLKTPAAK